MNNIFTMKKVNSVKEVKEIRIPVPWGHIAGKAWGDDQADKIVLTFHGLFDNAGSFDGLIQLLPNSFYYVCIDLPGHGRSSHFPPHLPIHTINYIPVYKVITKYFNRDSYIIMGHSYGGQIGLLFSILYSHLVEKLIMLDTIAPLPILPRDFKDYFVEKFDDFLQFQEKFASSKEPTYTYEEAFEKIQAKRNYGITITDKAATALVERAIEPVSDGKYKFTFDQRIKYWINPQVDFRYITEVLKKHPVKCPLLIILGDESPVQRMYMKPILDTLIDQSNAVVKTVTGNHDVHNCYPENVAPLVKVFLLNEKAKL